MKTLLYGTLQCLRISALLNSIPLSTYRMFSVVVSEVMWVMPCPLPLYMRVCGWRWAKKHPMTIFVSRVFTRSFSVCYFVCVCFFHLRMHMCTEMMRYEYVLSIAFDERTIRRRDTKWIKRKNHVNFHNVHIESTKSCNYSQRLYRTCFCWTALGNKAF